MNSYKVVPKTWGSETWIINTELYCMKILRIDSHKSGSLHYHKIKDETFYIQDGKCILEWNNTRMVMREGDARRIKPNEPHRFTACSDGCIVIEVSTHHDDKDTYRIEPAK